MDSNDECPSRKFGDSWQYTNWILDYGETCHMTPADSDFITSSLEDTDKYIEVADGNHVTAGKKGQVGIKMCDKPGDSFIPTLHKVLLAPDLCNKLSSIIKLKKSGHACLFHKGFNTMYFGAK